MGRFVTAAGVEIEISEQAARAVGYKPAEKKPEPAKRGRGKKSDEQPAEQD